MKKTIDTQICAVTVYSDRALVIRRGKIELTGEERELILADVPPSLATESVRVSGKGTMTVRLMGVRTETLFVAQPIEEKLAQLKEQINRLETEKRAVKDQIASLELRREFIKDISEKAIADFSLGLARQRVSLTETGDFLNFIGQHYSDYAAQLAQLEQQQQDLSDRIAALNRQKQQLNDSSPHKSLSIIVTLNPDRAGEFELEVSYTVNRATWSPLYDLRVDSKTNTLHLSYLAEVKQSTGEDWSKVALTLSTAKPGLGSLPPKLAPWYIDINPPYLAAAPSPAPMAARAKLSAFEPPTLGGAEESVESEPELIFEAEPVMAEVSKAGSVVTFAVGDGGDIGGDGSPHQVTILECEYPSRLQYVAIPRLVSFAYLEAMVRNPATGFTLLPGKANIFRDDTFVGTTQLENIAPGQEFRVNLGIDEGLKVERDLVERQVDKKLIGGQRRITFAYRLTINNLLSQANELKLTEQLPTAQHEKLKVRLMQVNPKIEPKEMGILEWNLRLAANSQQEVYYQFAIEYPPECTVYGLGI